MRKSFEKYHGTGNDFIIFDIRNRAIPEDADMISRICDRRFGIGADGVILLDESANFDFCMRYFNADGRESTMCGNGGRCVTAFAHQLGIISEKTIFEASDGRHTASIISAKGNEFEVKLQLSDVDANLWDGDRIFLDTGSPHLVKAVEGLRHMDAVAEGRAIRHEAQFAPGGTNVSFIEEVDGILNIRTFERGVEDETLSCGTGATAAALARALQKDTKSPVKVLNRGGLLQVFFMKEEGKFTDVHLQGPVVHVFSGKIEL